MRGDAAKVVVRRQHRKIPTEAKLGEESIDCADLNTATAAGVSQLRGFDVIPPLGSEQRQGGKPVDDLPAEPWPGKTLQQFL